MSTLYALLRPLIFRLQPEQAHAGSLALLRLAGATAPGRGLLSACFRPRLPGPEVRAFGLVFPNPVGLAAGYDKDGLGWRGLARLGFGHLELGTVTPRPQPGNPQPRVFRLVEERAVINRMGFPGSGAAHLARRIAHRRPEGVILGVNIGRNKLTPNQEAAEDYLSLLDTFAPLADYLAVNVSSPNTPGLRDLQDRAALTGLLQTLHARRLQIAAASGKSIPILVKLSPDLSSPALDGALQAALDACMDGVIIGNTTLGRDGLRSPLAAENGGLSGAPLTARNTALVRETVRRLAGRLPVIASGGVLTPADAQAKLDAGAVLVQVYTGLIYHGPGLVRDILNAPLRLPSTG